MFYRPFGKGIVVLRHGFSKKTKKCPPEQLKRAVQMKRRFEADPAAHTFERETDGYDREG